MKRFLYLITCLFWIQTIGAQQEQIQPDTVSQEKINTPLVEILPAIAKDAMEIDQQLLPVIQQPVIFKNRLRIDSLVLEVNRLGLITDALLLDNQGQTFHESLNLKWADLIDNIEAIETKVNAYTSELEEVELNLKAQKSKWKITESELKDLEYAEHVANPVGRIIGLIDSTLKIIQDSLQNSFQVSAKTTISILDAKKHLANINNLKEKEIEYIFSVREPAIWNIRAETDSAMLKYNTTLLYQFRMEDSTTYMKNTWYVLVVAIVFFLLMIFALRWLHKEYMKLGNPDLKELNEGNFVISRPIASAMMISLLLIILLYHPGMPILIGKSFTLLFLIPFLVIFHGMVMKPLRWSLFYFVILFILSNFALLYPFSEVAYRFIQLFITLATGLFFLWFILRRHGFKPEKESENLFFNFLCRLSPYYLIILGAALVLNIIGYNNLSSSLNFGTIVSITLALILGTTYISLKTLVFLFIQTNLGQSSELIREKSEALYNGFRKILRILVIYFWITSSLEGYQVWDSIYEWLEKIWNIGYQFGELFVSIGDVISFFLIIIFSWIISFGLKTILQKEVLKRLNLARGVPNAISSLFYYFLVVSGFMLALAYIGFNLSNLGLLAGALGFGIGFGLQNLIGNFIAGLILAFERPVTVGDRISTDGLEGYVIKVGIRTSVIRQYDGSQLIIPNADLITNKVTNWSLSNFKKRYIITIHTHLSSNPETVLNVINAAVNKVDGVLPDPPPDTYFHGIVERSLEFALYYWVSDNLFEVQSNVNLEIQKRLREANIILEIPLPVDLNQTATRK